MEGILSDFVVVRDGDTVCHQRTAQMSIHRGKGLLITVTYLGEKPRQHFLPYRLSFGHARKYCGPGTQRPDRGWVTE